MAYASSPLMLAIDRCIFDIPLEERLQARTSDIDAWTKTMLPIIRLSISEAQNQIRTGHQDVRTYFSDTAAPERNMNATQRLLPRPQRPTPLTQTASDLAKQTFDSNLMRQETSPLRLQPTFADPDIKTSVTVSLALQLR
jgi:hypothetical protein